MKSTYPLLAGAVAIVLSSTSSQGTVLVNETFTYPDGSLTSQAAWTDHSGVAGDLQVTGGQALVQHGTPSEDASISLGSIFTAGVLYYSFDFSVIDPGSPIAGGDYEYFAHFRDDGTDFTSRMDVVEAVSGGDFTVGIAGSSSTADATWPNDLAYATTYRATVRFDFGTGISDLWIDPTSEASASISSAADTVPDLQNFALRQSDSSLNEGVLVDNLIVATTFAEASGVPEPSVALLGGLGLIGLLRRRR